MIEGVRRIPLRQIPDERGTVFHMLKRTDPHFESFGEIYFSTVRPGVVKAWHLDPEMGLNYACISGRVLVVVHDDREGSPTRGTTVEHVLGPTDDYSLLQIAPGLWNGMCGLGTQESIVANCATEPHDWNRTQRRSFDDPSIPYDWAAVRTSLHPRRSEAT